MRKIAGPGSVDGRFVDYDPVTEPNGSVVTANFLNDTQDEILAVQAALGVAESAGSSHYMLACMKGIAIQMSKAVGEVFALSDYRKPSPFDKDDPDSFFPAICLDKIDKTEDLKKGEWPDLVPLLWAQKLKIGSKDDFEVSRVKSDGVSVTLTFADKIQEKALVKALHDDRAIYATHTDWRIIHIPKKIGVLDAGYYPIYSLEPRDRSLELQVSKPRGDDSGSFKVEFYPYRTGAGDGEARLFQTSGRALMSASDDGEIIAGLRMRDEIQNFSITSGFSSGNIDGFLRGISRFAFSSVDNFSSDIKTGSKTRPESLGVHLYIWGRTYNK